MTVSVDAAPKSFVFYKSGVYNESKCRSDLPDLDHAVFASGYGTTEDGQDYWWALQEKHVNRPLS